MIYTDRTRYAMNLAYIIHDGQLDAGKMPYIFHLAYIAEQMKNEDSTCVTFLHNAVENEYLTIYRLYENGFSRNTVEALKLFVWEKGTSYTQHIKNIKDSKNKIAIAVKIADIMHNLDESRFGHIDMATYAWINGLIVQRNILKQKVEQ